MIISHPPPPLLIATILIITLLAVITLSVLVIYLNDCVLDPLSKCC